MGKKKMYDSVFILRLTMRQRKLLNKKAEDSNITASAYLRNCITSQDIKSPSFEDMKVRKDLIREVNAVGTNINQIAKNVNGGFYSENEKRKLFALMQKLTEDVESILSRGG